MFLSMREKEYLTELLSAAAGKLPRSPAVHCLARGHRQGSLLCPRALPESAGTKTTTAKVQNHRKCFHTFGWCVSSAQQTHTMQTPVEGQDPAAALWHQPKLLLHHRPQSLQGPHVFLFYLTIRGAQPQPKPTRFAPSPHLFQLTH